MNFRKSCFTLAHLLMVCVIIAVLSLFVMPAAAQDDAGPSNAGIPTTLTNGTTVTSSAIKIDKQHAVGVVLTIQGNAAGTDNVIVQGYRSGDGSTFETSPPTSLRFTNAMSGSTKIVGYQELPSTVLGSAHSIRFTVQNTSGSVDSTNTVLQVIKKKERD